MAPGQDGPQTPGRLRPPGLGLMLAEARGLLEFNASLLLSPLLMRAPQGRWPSGADAAGVSRQRPLDGADAALSEGARLRGTCLEHGPQSRRLRQDARRRCATCSPRSTQPPGARSASSAGVSAASMRAIWRCRRRRWCARHHARQPVCQRHKGDQCDAALREAVRRGGRAISRAPAGDRRRYAGADHVDLFAHRRHRELAHLPAASLRYAPKISRCTSPAISGSA